MPYIPPSPSRHLLDFGFGFGVGVGVGSDGDDDDDDIVDDKYHRPGPPDN
jgi:hypothetical protein